MRCDEVAYYIVKEEEGRLVGLVTSGVGTVL